MREDKDRKKYQYAPAFNVQQPYGPKKEFHLLKIINNTKFILKFEPTELIEYLFCKIDTIYDSRYIKTDVKKNKFKKYLKIVEYLYDIEQNIRNPVTEYIRRNPVTEYYLSGIKTSTYKTNEDKIELLTKLQNIIKFNLNKLNLLEYLKKITRKIQK